MKKIKRTIRTLLCLVIVLFATSTAVMGCYRKDTSHADTSGKAAAPGVSDSQTDSTPTAKAISTVDRQTELAAAKKTNPDTVAWLYMPGAEVDDPVVQAKDNAYYLQKDENGNYSEWGCYYAHCDDHLSGRSELDKNTVIFGHSAYNCDPDGLKFTKLHRYMDAEFVSENPYIYLSVGDDDMVFQITACFITDVEFDYLDPNPTGSDLTEFFRTVEKKNWLDIDGVTFSEEDTVLTLSTCCRKYDEYNTGDQRLVVMAKLLPEGASEQAFTVRLASAPEMP